MIQIGHHSKPLKSRAGFLLG